jgi:putative endonuclease
MFYVYILQSQKNQRFYVGYSANPEQRLDQHNSGKVISTRNHRPWLKIYWEIFATEIEAINREKQIKKMKSRNYIIDLLKREGTR